MQTDLWLFVALNVAFVLSLVGLAFSSRALASLRARWAELVRPTYEAWSRAQLAPALSLPTLEGATFQGGKLTGRYNGRAVELMASAILDAGGWIHYRVRLPGGSYSQELPLGELGEQLGDGAQQSSVRVALEHLGKLGQATDLRVEEGWLVLRRGLTEYAKSHTSLNDTLTALTELAPLLGRVEIPLRVTVRAEGQAEAPTLAWTETEAGHVVCPYCRDGVDAEASLLLARCGTCRTLHHEECLAELGRCSVYGCEGERRERVAQRA